MAQHTPRQARHRRGSRPTRSQQARKGAWRTTLLGLVIAGSLAATVPAEAQAPTRSDQPVLLSADQVTFDEAQGMVTARGNVELSQGARTVRADTISYNQRTKVVTASGHIRLVEPSGDIVFADYAELTDDMKDAFISNIRVLMTDNARMAGNEGERREGRITRINRGVYSPCDLCKEDPTRAPLWQVRAVRVVHDAEAKEIRYKDATLELFGVPVAYTPYLSHPDASVERKTGVLAPHFGSNSDLGLFLRVPYYIDIAPDQDATVEVGGYTKQGLLLGGEYRKRFERGTLTLNGSITRGEIPNGIEKGNPKDTRFRGHFFGKGLFEIDETWRWGFDVKRASDPLYLRRYYDFREDVLTSRAFVEGFRGRSYAAMNAYAFQDLRYGNPVAEPLVLPLAQWNAMGEPGSMLGGRWSLDASVLGLTRRQRDGRTMQRITVQPGWQREIISNAGFVTTLTASVLATGYHATNNGNSYFTPGTPDNATRFRLFPQGQIMVRYPFVRNGENSSQLIEPIVAITSATRVRRDSAIPIEDSLDVEFDETNLFLPNRWPGIDRLEGGTRFAYGLRTGIYGYNVGSATLLFGQSYRLTRDTDYPGGSGLESRFSDYVGRLDLQPASWLDFNYGFRLDRETLKPRRHSVNTTFGVPELRVGIGYTYVDQTVDRTAGTRNELEQASFNVSSQLSQRWSVALAHIQAIRPQAGARASLGLLTYQDECFTFQTVARRDYTTTYGGEVDGNTIYFRLVFKNLGEFRTPGISASFLGSSGGNSQ